MRRGRTLGEIRYPQPVEFTEALCNVWASDASAILMKYIWQGYDLFSKEILDPIGNIQGEENIERSITQLLEPRIRKFMDPDAPFYLQHAPCEEASRKPPPSSPPIYDLGFVLVNNERSIFPIEAKLLSSDANVFRYVKEVNENYLTCRYAPFSKEGVMIGYLMKGDVNVALNKIAKKLNCQMNDLPELIDRCHKYSDHMRDYIDCIDYTSNFRCHHLIMAIIAQPLKM